MTPRKPTFPVRATKAVTRKRGDSKFVHTCLRTMELNQKLTKHSQKTLDMGRLHGGKYLCTNLGVKEGGGHLLEGGVFLGTYGMWMKFTFCHFFLSFRDVCLLQQEVHRKEVMEAKFHQDTEEQKQRVSVYLLTQKVTICMVQHANCEWIACRLCDAC